MKKQTIMSLLFQALLIAQIRCKATIDIGTDAVNIDVGVDEDDDDITDDFSNSSTASNYSDEMDATAFNNNETYDELSKEDASDLLPIGNQSSTAGAKYVATLDLGSDRLGVNYRPRGYGLGTNKVKQAIGEKAFSMELNRKAVHSAPENAEDASTDASTVVNDDAYVAAKETTNSGNSEVDDSYINVETKGNLHSNESIADRADIGMNEPPILVNMEYYQFQQNNSEDVDEDLDYNMSAHPEGSHHGHTAKPYSDQNSNIYKYGNYNGVGSRRGISYVPVLYQKKNYSNEIVYEPVYPNPRGYYVPTVHPQYVMRMKNAPPQPVNYAKVQHPVEN